MTSINFQIDKDKKELIEEITKLKGYNSVSEFIRESIDDKLNLEQSIDDFQKKNPPLDIDKIDIPEFIPDGKYLGISRNTIVVTGDSLGEVVEKLYEKFPKSAAGVLRKGKEIEDFEVLFSFFDIKNIECYQQAKIKDNYYGLLKIILIKNRDSIPLLGLIDTGASLMALDKSLIDQSKYSVKTEKTILTAKGTSKVPIYSGKFKYNNKIYELDFTIMHFNGSLPIKALIGKNFIDKFNLLFLGDKKMFCLEQF